MSTITKDVVLDWQVASEYDAFQADAFQFDAFQVSPSSRIAADLDLDYQVAPRAGAYLGLDYHIGSGVGVSATLDWAIRSGVTKDLTLDYAIAGSTRAFAELGLDWRILATGFGPVQTRIVIEYDGIDITRHVKINGCTFSTQANGVAGEADVVFRDDTLFNEFIVGKTLALKIDDEYQWRGFVQRVHRETAFIYDDHSNLTRITRFMRLKGWDINILLSKRFTFKKADPAIIDGPHYPANTSVLTALADLHNDWLDLRGDGIDVTTKVQNIGVLDPFDEARPWNGAQKWAEAVWSIASGPVGIFYIDPDKFFVFTDVDTPNGNPLSDRPAALVNARGYQRMVHTSDATGMANDFFAYGAGMSSSLMLVKRETDAASIDEHGLWQDSAMRAGVKLQASLDRYADSVVNGTVDTGNGRRRGRKDDKVAVSLTVFAPGFRVAQKIRFISAVHDIDEVIPIRKLTIKFEGAVPQPIYELLLSHEIDTPWGFWDPIGAGEGEPIDVITVTPPPVFPGTIIDSFSRIRNYYFNPAISDSAYMDGWGTGEEVTWANSGHNVFFKVDKGRGIMEMRMAEYPLLIEGNTKTSYTIIPDHAHNGDVIDRRNLLFKFRIGRNERLYWTQLDDARTSGVAEWRSRLADGTYIDGAAAAVDRAPLVDWASTFANLPAHVEPTTIVGAAGDSLVFSAIVPPGGYVTKFIVIGMTGDGVYYDSNGGGFADYLTRYGGHTSMAYTYGGQSFVLSRHDLGQGLHYVPDFSVYEGLFAGIDVPSAPFNQAVQFSISSGGSSLVVHKDGEIDSADWDGTVSPVFHVATTTASGGTIVDLHDGTKVIEPDFDYYLRWYRPNQNGSFVKIWESWTAEPDVTTNPAAWLAADARAGWDGTTGPWAPSSELSIEAVSWAWQTYNLEIDQIASLEGDLGVLDLLPIGATVPPPGTLYQFVTETGTGTVIRTPFPYAPGSIELHLNGTMQRDGLDYTESNPSAGEITLLFTPDYGDKLMIIFVVGI